MYNKNDSNQKVVFDYNNNNNKDNKYEYVLQIIKMRRPLVAHAVL